MMRKRTKKGSALIFVLVMIIALLIYATAFISASINQTFIADIFKRRAAAFNIAEAGLDHALLWLRSQDSPPAADSVDPWGGPQNVGGGTYTVAIDDLGPVGTNPLVRRYKVTSTGTFGNMSRVLSNYLKVDNFGGYLWWTNSETYCDDWNRCQNVWFWTRDHLSGPTHTNSHYNIAGNPVFDGRAHSVDPYIYFYNNNNPVTSDELPDLTSNPPNDVPVFNDGIELGVAHIDMPENALALRSAAASTGGLYLTGNTTAVFNSNGTIYLTNRNKSGCRSGCTVSIPTNGALFVNNGTLTVSGTLNGRLTVGASQDVIIPNNIVYADDPRDGTSDDTLGIISESDVVIDDIAPSNLEIDAAVMALNNSFMMENWDDYMKGTLTVYGGIIQDLRGPVGTFSGSTKMSGYDKNYIHDSRFINSPPPFMPNTGDYTTLSWEEN
ncbi:MAG: hypothetical protein M0R48_07145 [Candidatus Omnitrophica bacterium]|nr:hypothetical protein [Candidatus Omnitrophota bacterium]